MAAVGDKLNRASQVYPGTIKGPKSAAKAA